MEYMYGLLGRMGQQAYLVVFIGAALESAALLGLLVPGEALVLVAGFFAARGVLDLDALIAVVASGAALGDSIGYGLGRKFGRPGLRVHGDRFGITEHRLVRAENFFQHWGPAAVFLGRFVGFARALVPLVAGITGMPYRRFLPYNVAGAAAWATAFVLLGYFLGRGWHQIESWVGGISVLVAAVLILGWLLHRRIRWPAALWVEIAVIVLSASVFAAVAEDVVTQDALTRIDLQLTQWMAAHRVPILTQILAFVSATHATAPLTLATLCVAIWLIHRGEWRWLASLVAVVPIGMLLNVSLKHLFHRARPVLDEPLVSLTTYSFPSGHVTGSTLFYGFICVLVYAHLRSAASRTLVGLGAFFMVAVVALSRIYLGAHYLSDVLGSFAVSIAWLALSLSCIHGSLNALAFNRAAASRVGPDRTDDKETEE